GVSASVPSTLLISTVRAASLFAAGQAASSVVAAKVAALTEGVLKAMLLTRLKVTAAVLLAVGVLAAGTGVLWQPVRVAAQTPAEAKKDFPTSEELAKQAAAIKPVARELGWQQIQWVLDLTEGHRLAQAERRPIFLWVAGDDPLERC